MIGGGMTEACANTGNVFFLDLDSDNLEVST